MEHFWDIMFQLINHGTNTLHVAFIFLFSVDYSSLPTYCRGVVEPVYINRDAFSLALLLLVPTLPRLCLCAPP